MNALVPNDVDSSSIRVLLADGQEIARRGLKGFLKEEPTTAVIGEAGSEHEMFHLVEKLRPDVLSLAINLLRGGGGVKTALRKLSEQLPLLVLSERSECRYSVEVVESDVAGFLTKTESPAKIVRAVCGIAKGERNWFSRSLLARAAEQQKKAHAIRELRLTERERSLLRLLARGFTNSQIADELVLSPHTIKNQLTRLYEKVGKTTRSETIAWFFQNREGLPNRLSK